MWFEASWGGWANSGLGLVFGKRSGNEVPGGGRWLEYVSVQAVKQGDR